MKKSKVTTEEKQRAPRKPSKKEVMESMRIADELWEKRQELEFIQFVGHQTLQQAFNSAVKIVGIMHKRNDTNLKQAFFNAFEIYSNALQFAHLIQDYGIQTISTAKWLDPKWYNLTERDLFLALSPQLQDLLRAQGVNYA